MRSLFFHQGCEFALEIDGESWTQAGTVSGRVTAKSHNGTNASEVIVSLCYGVFKHVHAKEAKAFEVLQQSSLTSSNPDAQEWKFQLGPDCQITDKVGSLYICLGSSEQIASIGFMQLTIHPQKMIGEYLKVFENFHRFKIGPMKMKKSEIEVKMIPPASKEYGNVIGLNLMIKLSENQMKINYNFKVKELGFAQVSAGAEVKSIDKKFNQILSQKEYELFDGVVNQEVIIEKVREILHQVRPKIIY